MRHQADNRRGVNQYVAMYRLTRSIFPDEEQHIGVLIYHIRACLRSCLPSRRAVGLQKRTLFFSYRRQPECRLAHPPPSFPPVNGTFNNHDYRRVRPTGVPAPMVQMVNESQYVVDLQFAAGPPRH